MSRAWTDEQEDFIRKNIHLTNQELADKLGRTKASVEAKVRELGLARTFQKEEIEILKSVWGKRRSVICRALPRFTWRQISKKAHNLGLPSLKEMRAEVNLYAIITAMGVGEGMAQKWREAGLRVINDKTTKMKNNILMVGIDDFWAFAMKHPDIVDLTKLKDNVFNVLGVPPVELIEMQQGRKPLKTRVKHKVIRGAKRKEVAKLYYSTTMSSEAIAASFDISVDTLRHIASEYRTEGQVRSRATVVTSSFIRQLERLYYHECKTRKECAEELRCSISSVDRGLRALLSETRPKGLNTKR